ncbi:MAG: oxidoreductase [Alphaproteobacteria bacterium]
MKIACLGGGPAGLYFAILMKKAYPDADITVIERNRPDDTFGFGVVFSDATLEKFADADRPTYEQITGSFAHWDDIDIHVQGQVLTSTGHGFSGMSRQLILTILQRRCAELGVSMRFECEFDSIDDYRDCDLILAADGVNSIIRQKYADKFQPTMDWRPNRFVWFGTTRPFPAFTFIFKENQHGLWRVHAYQYMAGFSTFIVECTGQTFDRSGLTVEDEDASAAYMEELFAEELAGHKILKNRSNWRNFPIIDCAHWHFDNVVMVGDAVHTAHFSIGSGTKLAMEDVIALAEAVKTHDDIPTALAAYDTAYRSTAESLQRTALTSLRWFEETERYQHLPPIQFGFSLLTRSLRINHQNLALRDPDYVASVDRWFADQAAKQSDTARPEHAPPPMFAPFKLRGMTLPNRIAVSPICQYSAHEGTIDDWHLVHLGSRAVGGAGLVITETAAVNEQGRITPACAGLYRPEHMEAWRQVVDFVHTKSDAKIAIQLGHSGRKGATEPGSAGEDQPLAQGAWPLMSASALPFTPAHQTPTAMNRDQMDAVQADFVKAAEMAEAAGFDMIELHFAHGYLLSGFISPLTNRREDDHGGTLANRLRYPLRIFDAVRAAWPDHKPISIRISACDWHEDGLSEADSVTMAAAFRDHGCDIVDVSAGGVVADEKPLSGRLVQTRFSERVRLEAQIPTMAVGGITSYGDANALVAAGRADLCVLGRALMFDPYWPRHAAHEQGHQLPWPPQYDSVMTFTPRA